MYNHVARKVTSEIVQKRIDTLKIGQKMQDLPEELWQDSFRYYVKEDKTRRGGPNMRMIRLDPSKPSLTVTGFIFNKFVHPYENRFITVREAARLQGFPDDCELKGSLTSTQQQIGNAVPVQLAQAIFSQITKFADSIDYKNKSLSALSLFSGAGGLDIGAAKSSTNNHSINVKVALDNWYDACETLKGYNTSNTKVVVKDIRDISSPAKFWKENSGCDKMPDLVFGGPPCQAFSQAGKQKALDDERGQMIYEFIRYISDIMPSFFVMENVSNLISVYKGLLFKDIITKMTDLGYNVSHSVLCAADFGTPQLRNRVIVIGSKKEFGVIDLPMPTFSETPNLMNLPQYKTVGEAFAGL